ncbi:MAG TPA: proprotein convertase P-domain-containing protein, partial [Thermoanaerobaculia bacterium]|nr:proprotein convertase P-domain-containing protein [Thermoanaerobaculia bacterium]
GPGGTWGPFVYHRSSGSGAPAQTSTQPGSTYLRDITVDSTDWTKAYVVNDSGQVYSTANSGGTWTNITGNLGSGTDDLRTITFIPGSPSVIAVGGLNGVFRMATNNVGVWNQFGTGMTNAIVYDLEYDALDDVLVASTLGRGAWKLGTVASSGSLPTVSVNDVTVTEGNSGTANATFTVSLSAASTYTVDVDYAASNNTATAATTTVSNTSSITIPDSGDASPYPSSINVSGISGNIAKVTVTLNNFSHTYLDDVDILLVGPGGKKIMLMSDAGGGNTASGVNVTFDDQAATTVPPGGITSTSYRPTDEDFGEQFNSPAPSPFYDDALSYYYGKSPNGTWSLYVVDDAGGDSGSIAGGWSLNFTTAGGDYFPTMGSLTFNPGTTSRTFTVPVNGDTTAEITETYNVTLSNPINATISDGSGVGTITNDDALTAPTSVVATATTSTNVQVTWTAAAVANTYRIYRSANGSTYSQVGEVASSPFNDSTAAANTSYLYKVRAFAGIESGDSNVDIATTVIFSDPTLTVGLTPIKLAHFTELLTAVNAVRALAGSGTYPAIAFTAPTPSTSVTVRAQHLVDLRTGVTAPRNALLGGSLTFTDPTITAGSTVIKAVHINELRNAVK